MVVAQEVEFALGLLQDGGFVGLFALQSEEVQTHVVLLLPDGIEHHADGEEEADDDEELEDAIETVPEVRLIAPAALHHEVVVLVEVHACIFPP